MKALIVYADESGTHDEAGIEKGSQFPTIAGFAAPPSEWTKFCVQWNAVLKSYGAPYFHFREWAAASAAIRFKKKETLELRENPYYGWDLKRLDKFLITLAKVAGDGNKVLIAGAIRMPAFNRFKAKLEIENPEKIQFAPYPYKYCMDEFFKVYHNETFLRWGNFKCPVFFLFDNSEDPKWIQATHEVFDAFRKKDARMARMSFADKKLEPNLPLQAADMVAYRLRQMSPELENQSLEFGEIDEILLKNLLSSRNMNLGEIPALPRKPSNRNRNKLR